MVHSGRRRWSNSGSPSTCVMAEKRTGVSCLLLWLLWVVVRIGGFGEVVLVGVSAKRGTWGEFEHQERTEREPWALVIDGASGEAGLGEEDGGELNEPARLAGEAVDDGDYSDDSVMGFVAADGRYV